MVSIIVLSGIGVMYVLVIVFVGRLLKVTKTKRKHND